MPVELRIESVQVSERPVEMRLPFQFGSTEVRRTAEAYAEVTAVVGSSEIRGVSAQLMVPRWFDKRHDQTNDDTIDTLRRTVIEAARLAGGQSGTVAALSRGLRQAVPGALPAGTPALAAGFGPALIEMALIDAACRAAGRTFAEAAKGDLFGMADLAPPDIAADALRHHLGGVVEPGRIELRHTIGFDAPLFTADVTGGPEDGLPVSVEEVIARNGLKAFKIKLKGDPDRDLARLRDIAGLIDTLGTYRVTLDANEQYAPDAFTAFLAGLKGDAALHRLREATAFVEQPFDRQTARETHAGAYDLPLVIDESDDSDDALEEARANGWAGTSIKSCKGVLRALLNYARTREAGGLLSGEDLTCQPGLCWQQDTTMAAAVGVADVERNGHHFAGGMQGAPAAEISDACTRFPGLYRVQGERPALAISDGGVDIRALAQPGFGQSDHIDTRANRPVSLAAKAD
ncbi:enolase C-terminal domain-like protein [Tranquillimonas rosea]|uniref:enolase C-terminal domain-like protein n=1 Tax=Tranquillimonas rosea TaxID=641238 RepID=UPI000B860789|nr:enolase C-terminal domain-like protein [Tranquillimonas rosea]